MKAESEGVKSPGQVCRTEWLGAFGPGYDFIDKSELRRS
jgi:hypothetical protein